MDASKAPEAMNQDRRRLLGTATIGIAVAGAASLLPSQLVAAPAGDAIRPFRVNVPEEQLVDLRRRLAATRWPERETVKDHSQGVQLAKIQPLVRYWGTDYDWRKAEAKLNALPQFVTTIDGLDIQFMHVRSRHPKAMPLLMTHGWPGSPLELLKVIAPLTDPTAHGGRAEDAFDLVLPTYPGYGFSGKPQGTGWGPDRVARAWHELMQRLGYRQYVSQGGDWGAIISQVMAVQAPEGLLGIHINMPGTVPPSVLRLIRNRDPVALQLLRRREGGVRRPRVLLPEGFRLCRDDEYPASDAGVCAGGFAGRHACLLLRQVHRVDA